MYYLKKQWTTAKKTEWNGIKYDSKFEQSYGFELEMLKRAKKIKDFETHVKIPLVVNGYEICNYYVDFVVYHIDDSIEYVETKGWITDVFKIKWKLFEALFGDLPNVKLTLIQQGQFKFRGAKKLK